MDRGSTKYLTEWFDEEYMELEQRLEQDEEVTKGKSVQHDRKCRDRVPWPEIRFLHASVSSARTPIDIYIDGRQVIRNLPYLSHSSYLVLPAEEHVVEVYHSGNRRRKQLLVRKRFETDWRKHYTAALVDRKLEHSRLQMLIFEDDRKVIPGKARIRFIHLSPQTPSLAVSIKNRGVISSKVEYKEATEYRSQCPEQVQVELWRSRDKQMIAAIPRLQLHVGTIETWIAVNSTRLLNLIKLKG